MSRPTKPFSDFSLPPQVFRLSQYSTVKDQIPQIDAVYQLKQISTGRRHLGITRNAQNAFKYWHVRLVQNTSPTIPGAPPQEDPNDWEFAMFIPQPGKTPNNLYTRLLRHLYMTISHNLFFEKVAPEMNATMNLRPRQRKNLELDQEPVDPEFDSPQELQEARANYERILRLAAAKSAGERFLT